VFDITAWADRVRSTDATSDGPWELPALGEVTAPSAVLIRPDGYVAWVGDGTDQGLHDALSTWFGPPGAP
jgi:3-(3-hydroxy-phenyl)propionate hydroxylase